MAQSAAGTQESGKLKKKMAPQVGLESTEKRTFNDIERNGRHIKRS